MASIEKTSTHRVVHVIEQYGHCVELVPTDPHFHNISVGLYAKDVTLTIWTYSRKPGVAERIRHIRDQLVTRGGLVPVEGAHNQCRFPCSYLHGRALKFLLMQVVEKNISSPPEGEISVKDIRSSLTLKVAPKQEDGRWIYQVRAEGAAPTVAVRLSSVVSGFVKYGEMQKVSETEVAFPCGHRHDELARLLLPYARNVSSVEDMLQAAAIRGQLTTGTAGFTPL